MQPTIQPIEQLGLQQIAEFGGKACRLGVLHSHGYPVPGGVAIASDVLVSLLESGRIDVSSQNLLQHNLEVMEAISRLTLPPGIIDALDGKRDERRWSVRSSATCEDDVLHSFAGVFESIVDIPASEIPEAIRRCWASLYSDRAIQYSLTARIPLSALRMAVIVQPFQPGEISGVTFTADPVSGLRGMTIVNAVHGPCGGFVAGAVPSSRFVVDRSAGAVSERRVPDGAPDPGDDVVLELAAEAHRIEAVFGQPQDIEWTAGGVAGADDRQITILQSRPITRLAPEKFEVDWSSPEDAEHTWRRLPWAMPPFEVELASEVSDAMNPGARRSGLWWFYTRAIQVGPFRFERHEPFENDEQIRNEYYAYVQALANEGKNVFTDVYLPKILASRERLGAYESRLTSLSDDELIGYLREAFDAAREVMSYHWLVVQGCLEKADIDRLGEKYGLRSDEVVDLVHSESLAARQRRRVLAMAELVKQSSWLSELFAARDVTRIIYARLPLHADGERLLAAIDSFLDDYGLMVLDWNNHRCRKEEPWSVVGWIRVLLIRSLETHTRQHEAMLERQRAIEARLLADPATRDEARRDIELARKAFLVRDNHSFYIDEGSAGYYRSAAVEVARRLRERGAVNDADDVDFLRRDELIAALEGRLAPADLVAERRAEWRRQAAVQPPWFIGKPPEEETPQPADGADDAAGAAADRGSAYTLSGVAGADLHVRGVAATSLGPPGAALTGEAWREMPPGEGENGTILIATDVRGINPFLMPPQVTGLVFGGWGSPFDHIGIVAREMGIAAVFDVNDVTRIRDGDTVEILGASGDVRVTPGAHGG